MITPNILSLALDKLEKAVTADVIQDLVKEDLEGEAHNTLWRASDPHELVILKLCPSVEATNIEHKFDVITSFGEARGYGAFSETSLPLETKPGFERRVTNIRLLGETSSTFLLAHLQKTIKVEGATTADEIAHNLLLLNLLRKKAKAIYFMDTSRTRLGANSSYFRGLIQQIREGTDGTTGTSPYGSHIIDMEGQPFTIDTLRAKAAKIITLFGRINCLIMDPFCRADLEAGMDAAQRLGLPIPSKPFLLGQNIGGFTTQGGQVWFHTENLLSPIYSQGQYVQSAVEGAPTTPPSVSAAVGAPSGSNVSKWKAGDGGSFFWVITEIKNDRESLGRRWPTSGTQAVAAGQEVAFSVTPSDPTSDSFKVYRGSDGDADTEAYAMFEVANSGSGAAVSVYDLNHYRPNTSIALGLNIRSESQQFLHMAPSGVRDQYSLAVEQSERFFGMKDNFRNTVSVAHLGPQMGTMELATILATTSRPLLYTACAVQVRNPLQNIVFINIGSLSLAG